MRRKRDVPEGAHAARAIERRRLVDLRRHALQAGEHQHHHEAGVLPGGDDQEHPDREVRIAEPAEHRRRQPDAFHDACSAARCSDRGSSARSGRRRPRRRPSARRSACGRTVEPRRMPRSRIAASSVPTPICVTIEPNTMIRLLRSDSQNTGSFAAAHVIVEAGELPGRRRQAEREERADDRQRDRDRG